MTGFYFKIDNQQAHFNIAVDRTKAIVFNLMLNLKVSYTEAMTMLGLNRFRPANSKFV